jgi:NTP pyrophosphatase (non-canonical NTP hydrolase)
MLNKLSEVVHRIAVEGGKTPQETQSKAVIREQVLHLHSEVSELYEAYESGDEATVSEELADVLIMTLSLARALKVDVQKSVVAKIRILESRLEFK